VTHTREDVLAAVKATFQESDTATIVAVLDLYGVEPHERERERVQLAIVQLSAGSEEKLLELVRAAKVDYRDVLAWQELGPLPEAEGKKAQEEASGLLEKWGRK
jgi:hypothetical protein